MRIVEMLGEFLAIIGLDALNLERDAFEHMFQKYRGGVGTVFLKGLKITESGIFINDGILIKLLAFGLAHDTSIWNKFDVDLHPLAGMLHLFIRF